ncbi:hypothetical protein KA036_00990 [Candidatus Gracilibacteria bacterium]|nr:hypothetical protein [Candidatus Gracilibacteria bacterium]
MENTHIQDQASKKQEIPDSVFSNTLFASHFNITLWIGGITIGVMALFCGGGFLIDKLIGTKPLGMVAGLLIAFPFSQYAVNKKVRQIAFKIQKQVNKK